MGSLNNGNKRAKDGSPVRGPLLNENSKTDVLNPNSTIQELDFRVRRNIKWKILLKRNTLLILTVLGVFFGGLLGFLLRKLQLSQSSIDLVQFPGEIFMSLLKMLILPLLIASIISGLSQMDPKTFGRIGTRTVLYFMTTTVLAVILGIIMAVSLRPGKSYIKSDNENSATDLSAIQQMSTMDAILDLVRNMFPENLIQACFQSLRTAKTYSPLKNNSTKPSKNMTEMLKNVTQLVKGEEKWTRIKVFSNTPNVLGIITFSMAIGIIIQQMNEAGHILMQVSCAINEALMRLVEMIMWLSPIGIMSLIASKVLTITDLFILLQQLGMYMTTVLIGLSIHATIVLPTLYFLATRKNPFIYIKGLGQALLTAFGTASSSATLPITFECVEKVNGVDPRITRLVLPLGATINMDGTALYEAVAALFIAQVNRINLHFGSILTISLTATLASIGAASIPSAGLITMIIVLSSVGLPTSDISLIVAVDWFLDRFRTSVNVMGDALGAGIIDHLSKNDFVPKPFAMTKQDGHRNEALSPSASKACYEMITPEEYAKGTKYGRYSLQSFDGGHNNLL